MCLFENGMGLSVVVFKFRKRFLVMHTFAPKVMAESVNQII